MNYYQVLGPTSCGLDNQSSHQLRSNGIKYPMTSTMEADVGTFSSRRTREEDPYLHQFVAEESIRLQHHRSGDQVTSSRVTSHEAKFARLKSVNQNYSVLEKSVRDSTSTAFPFKSKFNELLSWSESMSYLGTIVQGLELSNTHQKSFTRPRLRDSITASTKFLSACDRQFDSSQIRATAMDSVQPEVCCYNGSAVYGSCVASAFKTFLVDGMPTADAPAFPGLPFAISVYMKDWYNQTIYSDSSSVLKAESLNQLVSISGSFVTTFKVGSAGLQIVLKPTFYAIDSSAGIAILESNASITFKFINTNEQLTLIQSGVYTVKFGNGMEVCPPGYVVLLDHANRNEGACFYCQAGTYSLNPLAGTEQEPSCLNCPMHAICNGGSSVQLSLGTWIQEKWFYKLVSCPVGFALVNSVQRAGGTGYAATAELQECVPCSDSGYTLDGNQPTCTVCPLGASCNGGIFMPLVPGSVWQRKMWAMRIEKCPPGFILVRSYH